jgi:hypothetical protein
LVSHYLPPQIFTINPWRELATSTLLLMELSWLALLYSGISQFSKGVPFGSAFLIFSVIYFTSHYLPRGMQAIRLKLHFRRGITTFLILLSLWIGIQRLVYAEGMVSLPTFFQRIFDSFMGADFIPTEFWTLFVILLIWRRGVSLARTPVDNIVVTGSFKIGILMMISYGLIHPIANSPEAYWVVFLFAFCGLVALSVSRLYEISHFRGGKKVRFNLSWLTGISISILAVLALGFLLSSILQTQLIEVARLAIRLVTGVALVLVYIAILPFLALIIFLMPWLERLMANLSGLSFLGILSGQFADLIRQLSDNQNFSETLEVISAGKSLLLILILIVIIIVTLVGLRLLQWKERLDEDEQGEIAITLGIYSIPSGSACTTRPIIYSSAWISVEPGGL